MLIYGSRTKQLAKELVAEKCPNCGSQHRVELYIFQKYAHVFWIPVFPLGKTVVSQCDYCKQILKQKEMPSSLLASYENLKAHAKTPIWTFSGLALLIALIIIVIISDKKNDARNAQLILTPQSGDVFEIKTSDNQYTLYKVDNVQGDSVMIFINDYETNRLTGLSDLKRKGQSAYTNLFAIHKKDLKEMFDKGLILDIERK